MSLIGLAAPAGAATLASTTWSVSKSTTGATGTAYTYTFTTATSATLTSVTMTVPAGTAGTPAVGTVSPASLAGGTVSLSGTTLTYSFTAAPVAAATAVSIQLTGLTNTTGGGNYTSAVTTRGSAGAVDTGTSGTVAFSASGLTSVGWSVSSNTTGATGVSYTYTFTTPPSLLTAITSFTMTVPPGTSGTPALGTVSPSSLLILPSVSLSGTTLTVSFLSVGIASSTSFSIQITGLTNTGTAGSYTSQVAANLLGGPGASGITNAVSFAGPLNLTSPSSLGWSGALTGTNQPTVDTNSGDQQFTVSDQTGTGAGWHITVSATTLTSGTNTMPNTGTVVFNGSTSSITSAAAPSVTCQTSCTPPVNTTTYPVAITTAASSPTPATVYDTSAGSGLGPVILGGSSAANPAGWWVNVPANARAGTYTTTVTVAVVSGP